MQQPWLQFRMCSRIMGTGGTRCIRQHQLVCCRIQQVAAQTCLLASTTEVRVMFFQVPHIPHTSPRQAVQYAPQHTGKIAEAVTSRLRHHRDRRACHPRSLLLMKLRKPVVHAALRPGRPEWRLHERVRTIENTHDRQRCRHRCGGHHDHRRHKATKAKRTNDCISFRTGGVVFRACTLVLSLGCAGRGLSSDFGFSVCQDRKGAHPPSFVSQVLCARLLLLLQPKNRVGREFFAFLHTYLPEI